MYNILPWSAQQRIDTQQNISLIMVLDVFVLSYFKDIYKFTKKGYGLFLTFT